MIYLDNAATSWPKAPGVMEAMMDFMRDTGANPGRAGHRLAVEAGRAVYRAREAAATLFNGPDPLRVIFGMNITDGLNLCLFGLLKPGDHVITSSMEHNSVIRPLRALEKRGISLSIVPCASDGSLDPDDIIPWITPHTKLVAVNHASNVTGTVQPIRDIGNLCRRYDLLMLCDTAQSGGSLPVDMVGDQIDFLCFTGHKSLSGPMGTGGLIVGDRVDERTILPLKYGGTGSLSDSEEQPAFLPDAFEAGTLNAPGLAGLAKGMEWLLEEGLTRVRSREATLTQQLIDGLSQIKGITVYGTRDARRQTSVVSFNFSSLEPAEAGLRLDDDYGILCRVGLHCSPLAHKTIGTFPRGTVRFGIGHFNTAQEINMALDAVARLAEDV